MTIRKLLISALLLFTLFVMPFAVFAQDGTETAPTAALNPNLVFVGLVVLLALLIIGDAYKQTSSVRALRDSFPATTRDFVADIMDSVTSALYDVLEPVVRATETTVDDETLNAVHTKLGEDTRWLRGDPPPSQG